MCKCLTGEWVWSQLDNSALWTNLISFGKSNQCALKVCVCVCVRACVYQSSVPTTHPCSPDPFNLDHNLAQAVSNKSKYSGQVFTITQETIIVLSCKTLVAKSNVVNYSRICFIAPVVRMYILMRFKKAYLRHCERREWKDIVSLSSKVDDVCTYFNPCLSRIR